MSTQTAQFTAQRRAACPTHHRGIGEIGSLLGDPNEQIATLAMERIAHGDFTDEERQEFLRENQDSDDMLMHKRIQQLSGALKMQALQDEFVNSFDKPTKLGLIKSLILLDRIYNPKSSDEYLLQLMRELYVGFRQKQTLPPSKALVEYMGDCGITTAPLPWCSIGLFLLGDILENHIGIPHILTVIAHAIAQANGIPSRITMFDGQLGVYFENGDWLCPIPKWQVKENMHPSKMHLCDPASVLRVILAILLANSAMLWNAYDVRLFSSLLARLDHIDQHKMPYPYGDEFHPKS